MPNGVTRWLEEIGLGEHAKSFVENDIGFNLLTRLSAEDLKELGLSIGHRRRFLDAAAKLKEAASKFPEVFGTEPGQEIKINVILDERFCMLAKTNFL